MRNSAFRKVLVAVLALNAVLIWLWRRSRRPPAPEAPPTLTRAAAGTIAVPSLKIEPPTAEPLPAAAPPRRSALRPLLASALALAVAGQLYFAEGQFSPSISTGIAFYLAAILIFTMAAVRAERFASASGQASQRGVGQLIAQATHTRPAGLDRAIESTREPVTQTLRSVLRRPRRLAGWLLVILQTVVLLDLLRVDPPLADYTLPFILWLSAIGLYIRTVRQRQPRAPTSRTSWWKSDWRIGAIIAAIMLVAFALRVWHVDSIPQTLGGDEGMLGLESIKTITGEIRNPFTTGWLSTPTLTSYFHSLTIRLFGQTVFALRLPWALVGTVAVLIVFQLVRRLAGLTLALMTAALLATYHYHIHFSRLGMNPIADPFFAALALLFLYRAYDRGETRDWALCGVVTGLTQYAYSGARFTLIIVAIVTLSFMLRDGLQFWHKQRRGILIMVGAAAVTAAPMIQYAIRFPLDYNARINLNSIFQSGWLEREQVVRNQGALPILLDQFQRAILAFNVYPDRAGFYGSPRPLFDFASGVLFLLGLGYATLRPGDRRLFPLLAWWWGATILGGALTLAPPSTHRLVTLGPPAVFFVALALFEIGRIAQRAWTAWSPRRLAAYLAVAVLAISIASVNWYFVEYTPLRLYSDYNTIVANEMATYMRDRLGSDWHVYFFGPPRMYIAGFGSIAYLAPDVEGVDVVEPLTAPPNPSLARPDRHAAFIFLPERRAELDFVRQTFPEGTLEEILSPRKGDPDPLFIVYRVLMRLAQ